MHYIVSIALARPHDHHYFCIYITSQVWRWPSCRWLFIAKKLQRNVHKRLKNKLLEENGKKQFDTLSLGWRHCGDHTVMIGIVPNYRKWNQSLKNKLPDGVWGLKHICCVVLSLVEKFRTKFLTKILICDEEYVFFSKSQNGIEALTIYHKVAFVRVTYLLLGSPSGGKIGNSFI